MKDPLGRPSYSRWAEFHFPVLTLGHLGSTIYAIDSMESRLVCAGMEQQTRGSGGHYQGLHHSRSQRGPRNEGLMGFRFLHAEEKAPTILVQGDGSLAMPWDPSRNCPLAQSLSYTPVHLEAAPSDPALVGPYLAHPTPSWDSRHLWPSCLFSGDFSCNSQGLPCAMLPASSSRAS